MLGLIFVLGLSFPAPLSVTTSMAPTSTQNDADEQYQFLAGLCDQGHYEMAVREARKFLEEHPRHAKAELARYRLASALFQLERPADAVPHYQKLVKRAGFEYAAESWLRLGQCELQLGRAQSARAALGKALASQQDYLHGPAAFFLAEAEFALEAWPSARQRYGKALRAESAKDYHPHALRGRAWSEFRLAEFSACAASSREFLRDYGDHELAAEVQFLMGDALFEGGEVEAAEASWTAVTAGPFHDAALRGRAFARSAEGDAQSAAQLFGELLALDANGRFAREAALQRGAHLLRAGHAQQALEALQHPTLAGNPEELYWLARAQAETGEQERALQTFERAARGASPELGARIATARGDLLYELGRLDESTAAYGEAGSDYALHAAATAQLSAGEPQAAAELASRFLEQYPDSPYRDTTRLVLGEALFALGEHATAREVFGELLTSPGELDDAKRARCQSRIAWCAYNAGDLPVAAKSFAKLSERYPGDEQCEEARYMEGRALLEHGDSRGATRSWMLYLDEHRDSARVYEVELGLSRLEQGTGRLERLLQSEAPREVQAQATFELAEKLEAAGRREEALAAYAHFVKVYRQHELLPRARYGYAWSLRAAGRPAEATLQLDALLKDSPTEELQLAAAELAVWSAAEAQDAQSLGSAWTRYARVCTDEEQRLAALRVVARALQAAGAGEQAEALLAAERKTSGSPAARAQLDVERAWIALDAGRIDEAEARVADALESEARSAEALEAAFFVGEARFEAGSFASAAALYECTASAQSELTDDALYKLGFARFREAETNSARYGDAAGAFAALVEGYPGSELFGESLFLHGECAYRLADYRTAADSMARVRAELPRHDVRPKALFRMGLALFELGDHEAAAEVLTELVKKYKDFEPRAEAEVCRGRALAANGKARAARACFDAALASDKGVFAARARIEIGLLYLQAGEHDDALSEFLKVSMLYAFDEEVAQASFLAGRCLEAQGEQPLAKKQYDALIAKYADSAYAAAARKRLAAMRTR